MRRLARVGPEEKWRTNQKYVPDKVVAGDPHARDGFHR
jgi:hypothetical protein